jgi:WD40 repeat protein/transcriptional regulator with XRE-family HTH domain
MPVSSTRIALDQFTTFGDMLKYLRRRVGLTQRELSIAVGYSDAQISRLEQNERMPDLATLTARFLPALHTEDQPEIAARLLELAAAVRREDAPAAGLPPYKGLYYFDECDAEWFFGREELTETLINHVNTSLKSDQRFLAVVGASGSGKSSVVRAGLIPALRWRQPSSGWPVYVITPTAHPLDVLAGNLLGNASRNTSVKKLVDELVRQPLALSLVLKDIAKDTGIVNTLLVVDQFEELFTLCRSEIEQSAFVENLLTAALQPNGVAIVIIVLRADFYAYCARFDLLRQALSKHQEFIGPMITSELRCAIEAPALRGHWELEQGLTELLLHDVGADAGHAPEPGALPLLSHALLSTWQRRRGHRLTLSGYTASGGIHGSIAETAEAVFQDQLDPEQRMIARQIFLRLTELGDDTTTADTRRRVSFDELASRPEDREQVHEVLMTLADARLITTDQNAAEVAHEALIREWPTLRNWLDENREGLRLHRHLTETALEWEALGRDPDVLYRGARLVQAIEWSLAHQEDLNLLERSFLEASQVHENQEAIERETQRQRELEAAHKLAEAERVRSEEQTQSNHRLKQRSIFLTIAFFTVGILAFIAFGFGQRAARAENLATARELSAAAVNNLQIDPERSVLLALQALETADILEARNALHQSVPEMHLIKSIFVSSGGVPGVAYSPDGRLIATMSLRQEVKLWDANSGTLLRTLLGVDEPGGYVAISPDGTVVAGSYTTQVVLWDIPSGDIRTILSGGSQEDVVGYNVGVGQISFSPDGKFLATANMDGVSTIWDIDTSSKVLSLISAETLPPKAIDYSPDGKLLANGGDVGIVRVWDAKEGTELFSRELGGIIHALSFSPDGKFLAAASEDGGIKAWDAWTGEVISSPPRQSGMYNIAFLADGRYATAGQDGTTRVWDPLTGQQVLLLAGPNSTVISVDGSPDGKRIITGAYDGNLRIWDATPGKELMTIPAHGGIVWEVAYSPDGKHIASASVDGTVKIWDASSGNLLLSISGGKDVADGLISVAFSPDGKLLAAGNLAGRITIWNSQNGEVVTSLSGHKSMAVDLTFSPDGKRLASASWDGTAKIWDLTNQDVLTISVHASATTMTSIAFSPDGKTVFTGADEKFVRQWDSVTGQEIRTYSSDGIEIYGVAINPDGNLLAASHQDGNIQLWDVKTGEKLHLLTGHAGLGLRVTFSNDGARLASVSFDRLAKVWDVKTGKDLASLFGNASNVFGASFSPDGNQLATAGADGTVRIYTLRMYDLIALAKSRLTRSLTDEECRKYLHIEICPAAP